MAYKQLSPIPVDEGGTGAQTLTDHGVVLGSGTGAVTVTAVGTTGQVLTGVTGADPVWASPASSSITLTPDTGGGISGTSFNILTQVASNLGGASLLFNSSGGDTLTLYTTDNRGSVYLGQSAGVVGAGGNFNTALGHFALNSISMTADTGNQNVAVGHSAAINLVSGNYNVILGETAGTAYTGAESSNIILGYLNPGTLGESNVLRIGNATGTGDGNLNQAVICGIAAQSTGEASSVVLVGTSSDIVGTTAGGTVTLNTSTNQLDISADASATTVNVGTGAAAKTVTVGSTNTTSSLALKYGTSDFTLASATGTVMSALDTGEITYPLQSAFGAYLGTTDNNATGDGTNFRLGSGNALTELFDQNGDFVTTGTFTAPVTGKYFFFFGILTQNTLSGHTTWQPQITTTGTTFNLCYQNGFVNNAASAFLGGNGSVFCQMTAGDTCTFNMIISGSTKTVEIVGNIGLTFMGGHLVC